VFWDKHCGVMENSSAEEEKRRGRKGEHPSSSPSSSVSLKVFFYFSKPFSNSVKTYLSYIRAW
jgi:hypothetical protein